MFGAFRRKARAAMTMDDIATFQTQIEQRRLQALSRIAQRHRLGTLEGQPPETLHDHVMTITARAAWSGFLGSGHSVKEASTDDAYMVAQVSLAVAEQLAGEACMPVTYTARLACGRALYPVSVDESTVDELIDGATTFHGAMFRMGEMSRIATIKYCASHWVSDDDDSYLDTLARMTLPEAVWRS